jgi:hypothetical protein
LQAAVALVLASFQPQPKAVACQPTIVERVYEMGSRVNKTDISELTVALNDVAEELRSSRIELARMQAISPALSKSPATSEIILSMSQVSQSPLF